MFNDWHYVLVRTGQPASKTSPNGWPSAKVRAVPRKALPAGQDGAQALRAGGSRRAGGDLARRLGEVGSQGPPVERAPLARQDIVQEVWL